MPTSGGRMRRAQCRGDSHARDSIPCSRFAQPQPLTNTKTHPDAGEKARRRLRRSSLAAAQIFPSWNRVRFPHIYGAPIRDHNLVTFTLWNCWALHHSNTRVLRACQLLFKMSALASTCAVLQHGHVDFQHISFKWLGSEIWTSIVARAAPK